MLKQAVERANLRQCLLGPDSFRPFPAYADRAAWQALDREVGAYYAGAGRHLVGYAFPMLPAVRYMDFERDGNRSRYEAIYFERRAVLVEMLLAECLEGQGRYIDDITNGVWAICEETNWVIPAHNSQLSAEPLILPDIEQDVHIDLFSAETGSLFTWIYYFLGDAIAERAPQCTRRMEIEVKRRILDPFLTIDRYGWKGLTHDDPVNNWNPWINSNILPAFLVFERDEARRIEGVRITAASAQRFLDFYHEDGGCDEGPGYFGAAGASLLDYLEILSLATLGAVDLYGEPLIRNMARYILHAHVAGRYYVNFADAPARLDVNGGLLARVGRRLGDDELVAFSQGMIARSAAKPYAGGHNQIYRLLRNIMEYDPAPQGRIVAPADHWFGGIQVMIARQVADAETGLFLAAKGGTNAESHNHNDVGSLIVYKDGRPVLIDAGVESYTKKTFSARRYEIWTMQSGYHNLPTVNGHDQLPGLDHGALDVAYAADDARASLTVELKAAYPTEAGIESLRREVSLDRKAGRIAVRDAYRLARAEAPLVENLLCLEEPQPTEGGFAVAGARIAYDATAYDAIVESIALTDAKLARDWGQPCLYRIRLTARTVDASGACEIAIE